MWTVSSVFLGCWFLAQCVVCRTLFKMLNGCLALFSNMVALVMPKGNAHLYSMECLLIDPGIN